MTVACFAGFLVVRRCGDCYTSGKSQQTSKNVLSRILPAVLPPRSPPRRPLLRRCMEAIFTTSYRAGLMTSVGYAQCPPVAGAKRRSSSPINVMQQFPRSFLRGSSSLSPSDPQTDCRQPCVRCRLLNVSQ